MTRAEAEQVAREHLRTTVDPELEPVLLDEETLERNFGWVFFYQSKRYLETGEIRDALAGNAPLVVTKADGRIHITGTAYPVEHYLERFEE
jgi:hypothetical protein